MGLFRRDTQTVALIEIGSSSVAGGYASIGKDGIPHLHYATRVSIPVTDQPVSTADMLRTLATLGKKLIAEGSPRLRTAVGSGKVDRVIASIGSPWQETTIRNKVIEQEKPFTFTKALLTESDASAKEHVVGEEIVIAALLNGYEIRNPFGKKATRAELMILSSTIDHEVSEAIREALSYFYHTKDITLSAFAPIVYTVFRDLYPHEKDYLVLHVSGEASDLALVKRGILVSVASVSCGLNGMQRAGKTDVPLSMVENAKANTGCNDWIDKLAETLQTFSETRALPRTVFLLAEDSVRDYLVKVLDDPKLHSLWLSDEPLTVIPSLPQHLKEYIICDDGCERDLFLSLLALSVGKQTGIES